MVDLTAGHWTEDMREDALEPAQLNNPDLKVWPTQLSGLESNCATLLRCDPDIRQAKSPGLVHRLAMLCQVVDVGGGTGFCTLGIVKTIKPSNVTLIDQ
jgi:MPBQ/MSBQ methyltransferase